LKSLPSRTMMAKANRSRGVEVRTLSAIRRNPRRWRNPVFTRLCRPYD
jgi:hypothetical protein